MICGYKIRDRQTGLFKHGWGGLDAKFSKGGKVWSNLGALKSHLKVVFGKDYISAIPLWWELVVCYELPLTTIPLSSGVLLGKRHIANLAFEQYNEALKEKEKEQKQCSTT